MEQSLVRLEHLRLARNGMLLLNDVSLDIVAGEFHVLVGDNGSSKTTLINTIAGVIPCREYSGILSFRSEPVHFHNPGDAIRKGIVTMHQQAQLYEDFSIAENLYPDTPLSPQEKFKYSKKEKIKLAQELLDSLNISMRSTDQVKTLTSSQKRMLEIARMTTFKPDLAIFDEPTAGFNDKDVDILLKSLADFSRNGATILYTTHKFEEVKHLADRMSIIKEGQLVNTIDVRVNPDGAPIYYRQSNRYPKIQLRKGKELFCVENISHGNALKDISITLHQSEIIGIAGMEDSGKTLLGRVMFGLEGHGDGRFYIDRLPASIDSARDAIHLGIAYVTDERTSSGLFWNLSTVNNVLVVDNVVSNEFLRSQKFEDRQFKKYSHRLNLGVKTDVSPTHLSGGEQQKLLLLRWIMSTSKVFILDKPTSNLDIASKIDTYNLINDLVHKKAGVIIISSDVEELMGVCDSILVMKKGEIVYRASRGQAGSFDQIREYM